MKCFRCGRKIKSGKFCSVCALFFERMLGEENLMSEDLL